MLFGRGAVVSLGLAVILVGGACGPDVCTGDLACGAWSIVDMSSLTAPIVTVTADPPCSVDTDVVVRMNGSYGALAPRRPPPGDRKVTLQSAIQRRLAEEIRQNPSMSAATLRVLQASDRARAKITATSGRFEKHAAVVDRAVGVDFVKKGLGKRYVHRQADLPFIAERFLSSYLLIVAFRDVGDVDALGVVLALERARATICDLLAGLPPDGGGHEAISNAMRWR